MLRILFCGINETFNEFLRNNLINLKIVINKCEIKSYESLNKENLFKIYILLNKYDVLDLIFYSKINSLNTI